MFVFPFCRQKHTRARRDEREGESEWEQIRADHAVGRGSRVERQTGALFHADLASRVNILYIPPDYLYRFVWVKAKHRTDRHATCVRTYTQHTGTPVVYRCNRHVDAMRTRSIRHKIQFQRLRTKNGHPSTRCSEGYFYFFLYFTAVSLQMAIGRRWWRSFSLTCAFGPQHYSFGYI